MRSEFATDIKNYLPRCKSPPRTYTHIAKFVPPTTALPSGTNAGMIFMYLGRITRFQFIIMGITFGVLVLRLDAMYVT